MAFMTHCASVVWIQLPLRPGGQRAFVSMASEVGLWVTVCPGPYIRSDLDLGGLPSWLLWDPNMRLWTAYKGFQRAVNRYFDQLIPKIEFLQVEPISVTKGSQCLSWFVQRAYRCCGLRSMLATIHLKDVKKKTYEDLCSSVLMKDVHEMFKLRFSLNFYMFHGGTNFGFMGGAESLDVNLPAVTSYGKYFPLELSPPKATHHRTLELLRVLSEDLNLSEFPTALPPEHMSKVVYNSVMKFHFMSLWEILPYLDQPITSDKPVSMEQLSVNDGSGQSFSYTLYETSIIKGGLLTSRGHVQDWGQVFLNEKYIGVLDHSTDELYIKRNVYSPCLTGDIYLDSSPLRKFVIYSLEMKTAFMQRAERPCVQTFGGDSELRLCCALHCFSRAHFTLERYKFLIFRGSIHYFWVPRQYWRDRLLKLKACGLNTVTTAFVLLAAEIELWVILCPGPYVCAEMDFRGLPSWFLQDPKTQLRTNKKSFMDTVDEYFDQLIPRMLPLQETVLGMAMAEGPALVTNIDSHTGKWKMGVYGKFTVDT
ncbi:Beta-galactosidase-1-like protein 2 [Heterocephalus glaber]|uniref:Beta-galactosidase-1-like protein 2 n=1 Tax=Heterocephalus glaber TaxID=10181 RepID=G5B2N5_HETGA|nr:Beta-galactosidase-1-like protein 2 [Heterocephalus glaber]